MLNNTAMTQDDDLPLSMEHSELIESAEADADGEPELTVLLDKYVVDTEFFDTVECNFWEIYPHLLEDTDFGPEDLCGEEFWNDLSELGQRLALLCLKHLAAQEDFPLYEDRCAECGTGYFRIF